MVLLGMQNRIVEYNQENLRIESLEGGPPGKTTSLIRSFPSKVGVRARVSNPRTPPAAGQSRRQPSALAAFASKGNPRSRLARGAAQSRGPPRPRPGASPGPRQDPRRGSGRDSSRVGARAGGGCGALSGTGIRPACGLRGNPYTTPRCAQRHAPLQASRGLRGPRGRHASRVPFEVDAGPRLTL